MKVRRPEFKRARKIRQRARKRWPTSRSLNAIFSGSFVANILCDAELMDCFKVTAVNERGGRMSSPGLYIESVHFFDVK